MKKLIYILPLALFFVMVGFFIIGLERDPRLIPSPFIDKPMPTFSLTSLFNQQESFSQTDVKGQVSLLNFWATWCPTCRAEHSVLLEIAKQNSDLAIYGVDYKDKQDAALAWLEQLGNPYRQVGFDQKGNVGIDFGVYGTPETFVLDKEGIVRYKHVGAISWQDWTQTLEPIVKKLNQ